MNYIKSLLSTQIKFPFWWLFKSPQREWGIKTVWNDLIGIGYTLFRWVFPQKKLQPISICVGVYNRSDMLLNHLVPSIQKCADNHLIELSIFDCSSTDRNNLEIEIRKVYQGKLQFRSEPISFSRAKAFNRAIDQSLANLIFICDADFSLPSNLVQKVNNYVCEGKVWFPIVYYLYKNKPPVYSPKNGEWMLWGGKGIVGIHREDFVLSGRLDESYITWGAEDEAFWHNCHKKNRVVIRTREKELVHHWHPSLNPKYKLLEELSDKGLL
jgi:glycosyltransferase involved in cell wall biosynthesis